MGETLGYTTSGMYASFKLPVAGDLPLTRPQRVALGVLHAFSLALPALAGPFLSQAGGTVLSSVKCPFDTPPAEIKVDFDPEKKMYLRCLHASRHCWNLNDGKFIACP